MSWKRRVAWRIGGALLLIQIALPGLLLGCKNSVLFHPAEQPTAAEGLPALARTDARLVTVTRPDGRELTGYDARPRGAVDTPVLLCFHGNAGNAALRASWLAQLVRSSGLRVVLASYSGFGANAGSPSEGEIDVDALAFFDHLTASGVPAAEIVVYGESIGGGPASYVADQRPCAGLILQSTFSSLSSMAREAFPWLPLAGLLTCGDFPNAERAAAATCPLLVAHGTRDGIVPFAEGEAIATAAPRAEFVAIDGAGHNDVWRVGGADYVRVIVEHVARWSSRRSEAGEAR